MLKRITPIIIIIKTYLQTITLQPTLLLKGLFT